METNLDQSLIQVSAATEFFPRKSCEKEDPDLEVPFPCIQGEFVEYLGRTSDGILTLSNYRLFLQLQHEEVNLPLGLIETIEARDIFFLHIFCKDARYFK